MKKLFTLMLTMFTVLAVQAQVTDGYYTIQNKGNGKYINVLGRRTVGFSSSATNPGAIYRIKAVDKKSKNVIEEEKNDLKVDVLRSQGVDLPGYATRGLKYVDGIVDMVVQKLGLEGSGELFLLGENGKDAILEAFHDGFDENLYLEPTGVENEYRIYGKTPSMEHVVKFYGEHRDQIREKLPMLEGKINQVIQKVLNKLDGHGTGILLPYKILDVWERMSAYTDGLTKPVEGENDKILEFYDQILSNKDNVWNFAYESVMMYWERVKKSESETLQNYLDQLGDFSKYFDRIENVHPDFRYYIVADGNGVDFISQGNSDILNPTTPDRTVWVVNEAEKFTKTFDETVCRTVYTEDFVKEYCTTFYADFGYEVPDGCKAYAVTKVDALEDCGLAGLTPFEGVVPEQTPVLLMSTSTSVDLKPTTASGTVPEGNLLVGADVIVNEKQLKTPIMETLFDMAKGLLGGEESEFYQQNIAQYEHLMLRNAGTVNNKYFFGLSADDLKNLNNLRVLGMGYEGQNILGFHDLWEKIDANQAFMIDDNDPVKLPVWPDIDRDGYVDIYDVTALIEIVLYPTTIFEMYDYDVADVDRDGAIDIYDVTLLIDIVLHPSLLNI